MSLRKIWNKLVREVIISDMLGTPPDLRRELEAQGWKFNSEYVVMPCSVIVGCATMTNVTSPAGIEVHADPQVYSRYTQARRDAAAKLYGPL